MRRLLCEEKLKHKESTRKRTLENEKLKKELLKCREKLKVYEINFEANKEAQNIEVVYNEEVISTDDNTTFEKQIEYEVSASNKFVFTVYFNFIH